jgi:hypothetical protein
LSLGKSLTSAPSLTSLSIAPGAVKVKALNPAGPAPAAASVKQLFINPPAPIPFDPHAEFDKTEQYFLLVPWTIRS